MKKVFFLSLSLIQGLLSALSVDIIPEEAFRVSGYLEDEATEYEKMSRNGKMQYLLKAIGGTLQAVHPGTLGRGDILIVQNHQPQLNLDRLPRYRKKILITWEPPTVQPSLYSDEYLEHFDIVFTWNDHLVESERFFRMYYPSMRPMHDYLPSYQERKLCCMVCGNKESPHPQELYSMRAQVIDFYTRHKKLPFDLYGTGWESKKLRCYRGAPENKDPVMMGYRFSYTFENYHNDEGYVTEKIFDAFANGTIPIYLGAHNITDYIPANCFIDARQFGRWKDLHRFLEHMDEETFLQYQKNIRLFLATKEAAYFTPDFFASQLIKAILHCAEM